MKNVLRVVITILLLADLSQSFAQFPGCPQVVTSPVGIIPCGQTCTNLYASAEGGFSTTTYTYATIPYAPPVAFNVGTAIPVPGTNGDDYWSPEITLPFHFCYFGVEYTSVIVSSNGAISFDVGNAGLIPSSWEITGTAPANNPADMLNCVMTPWQDLDNTHQGQIYYTLGGTSPCQYFVASWYNCCMYGDAEDTTTGYCTLDDHQYQQVIFYQTSNVIDINIQAKAAPCNNGANSPTYWNGGLAVEGLVNAAGSTFIGPAARNATQWSATMDAIRFTPNGLPTYTITWFQGTTQIGTGSPISVCPAGLTTYVAKATYTNCDNSVITVSDSVFVNLAHLTVSDSFHQPSCGSNNGSVYASFNANSGVISYGWAPGGAGDTTLNNLGPGTYIFTVSDSAGCTKADTVTLTAGGGMTVSVANDTVNTCTGTVNGTLIATVTGGTGPFTYAWSGGAGSTDTVTGLAAGTYTVTVMAAGGCTATASGTVSTSGGPPVIITTVKLVNVTCSGGDDGEIVIAASGGPPPYSYNWSNIGLGPDSITGLVAGPYSVTVTDRFGCTADTTYTITQGPPITFNPPVITNVSCNGGDNGSITVSSAGGVSPYTYVWGNGGITGATDSDLVFGTYFVTATDTTGCTASASYTVNQASAIVFGPPVIDSVSCFGGSDGSITVNASGGTGIIGYVWNVNNDSTATAGNLSAGTYIVTATDSLSCSASASYSVGQPTQVVVDTVVLDSATCSVGGAIIITAGGGTPPYTYTWSVPGSGDSIGGLAGGTYTVTITDGHGCSITASATVPTAPNVVAFGPPVIVEPTCSGDSTGSITATASGGTGTISFAWSNIDSVAKDSNLIAGTYSVTITDQAGCTASTTYILNQPAPVTITNAIVNQVTCFNGSNGSIYITVTGGTGAYTYDWSPNVTPPNISPYTDSVSGLGVGSYQVTVLDTNGCSVTATYNLAQPLAITIDTTVITPVGCVTGGSIVITASDGGQVLTYTWSGGSGSGDSIGGLNVGVYTVTITNPNGCSITASDTVTALPGSVTIDSATITNLNCNGDSTGSITVVATDSSIGGKISYAWGNGDTTATISNLKSGTYCVTVTDSLGCSATACYTVSQPGAIIFGPPVFVLPACNDSANGCITATATGGSGTIVYSWGLDLVGASLCGITAGTYTVTATDSLGCSATASYTLTQPSPDSISGVVNGITCAGLSNGSIIVTATGGSGQFTYNWGGNNLSDTLANLGPGVYCVTATDINGCSISACYTIQDVPALNINAMVATPVTCAALGTDSVSASGGTGTLTYSWSPGGQTTAVITGLAAGTYCVTVSDSLLCTVAGCDTVINSASTVVIDSAHVTSLTCTVTTGSIIVYASGGNTGLTYTWSGTVQTGDTITNLAAGTYSVTVADSTGCSATASYTVDPATPATITNAVVDSITCNGLSNGSITITATGTGTLVYAWSPNVSTTNTATGLAVGSYCVTVTDSLGCTATACYNVGQPLPISVSGTVTNVTCSVLGSINVTASGGTGGLIPTWIPNTVIGFNPTGLSAGQYIVGVTDQNGCGPVKDTFNITGSGGSSITISNVVIDSVTCFGGNNGSISITATGGSGTLTYLWAPNLAITNPNTGLTAGQYGVIVTDTAGCTAAGGPYTVGQPTIINVNGTVTNVTCSTLGSINLNPSGGTPGIVTPYTYSWTPNTLSGSNPTGLSAGTYTVTVTDGHGCTVAATFTINGSGGAITLSDLITNVSCGGVDNGSITVTPSNGAGDFYTWAPNVGTGATVTNLAAGTYSVTVSDDAGCSATATYTVGQSSAITIILTAPSKLCAGVDTGTASVVVNPGGTAPYSYHWSNNADTLATDTGVQAGNVAVTVTDANGCTASASQAVGQDLFDFADNILQPSCAQPIPSVVVSITIPGTPPYTYTFNGVTNSTGVFDSIFPGSYVLTVTDSIGCSISTTDIVNTPPATDSVGASETPTSCTSVDNGQISVYVAALDSSHSPFTYSINGGAFQDSSTFKGLAPGSYNIVVHNNLGCNDTITTPIVVTSDSVLTVTFVPDTLGGTVVNSDTITLTPNTSGFTNPVYSWSPSTGLSCTSCANPIYSADPGAIVNGPTIYYVTVSDSLNPQCAAYDSVIIEPKGQFAMPNAFTPNGDGVDDLFGPVKYSYVTVTTFHIYNRWGQLVHNSTDDWDGKFDGKPQPEGAYVYYIEVTHPNGYDYSTTVTEKKEGSVILLR